MEMNYELLQRRLAYIKGYLHNIKPQLNEAYQEETTELIWAIKEDIEQLKAIILSPHSHNIGE
jgi:DNA-binding FrmR family transcriptional regulator